MNTQTNPSTGHPSGSRWLLPVLLALLWSACSGVAFAQSEDGIKAAFIYNFSKFVEWPAAAFASPSAPLTVGFVGGTSLADNFEQNTKGKNAGGRDFAIKKLTGATGAEACQILYVADAAQLAAVLGATKGKPILVLGEPENILDTGGMIRFVRDGTKVVFDVNLTAVNGAGLKVDPKLQKAARSVKGG